MQKNKSGRINELLEHLSIWKIVSCWQKWFRKGKVIKDFSGIPKTGKLQLLALYVLPGRSLLSN